MNKIQLVILCVALSGFTNLVFSAMLTNKMSVPVQVIISNNNPDNFSPFATLLCQNELNYCLVKGKAQARFFQDKPYGGSGPFYYNGSISVQSGAGKCSVNFHADPEISFLFYQPNCINMKLTIDPTNKTNIIITES